MKLEYLFFTRREVNCKDYGFSVRNNQDILHRDPRQDDCLVALLAYRCWESLALEVDLEIQLSTAHKALLHLFVLLNV
jgi:hypothetical protein